MRLISLASDCGCGFHASLTCGRPRGVPTLRDGIGKFASSVLDWARPFCAPLCGLKKAKVQSFPCEIQPSRLGPLLRGTDTPCLISPIVRKSAAASRPPGLCHTQSLLATRKVLPITVSRCHPFFHGAGSTTCLRLAAVSSGPESECVSVAGLLRNLSTVRRRSSPSW